MKTRSERARLVRPPVATRQTRYDPGCIAADHGSSGHEWRWLDDSDERLRSTVPPSRREPRKPGPRSQPPKTQVTPRHPQKPSSLLTTGQQIDSHALKTPVKLAVELIHLQFRFVRPVCATWSSLNRLSRFGCVVKRQFLKTDSPGITPATRQRDFLPIAKILHRRVAKVACNLFGAAARCNSQFAGTAQRRHLI